MYFTPTISVAQLLVAVQVLMTLNVMPLSTTTMALPVTSKPIESTVENLAWQAWIELPPEEKQQVKSRKVTPKSIFTLPLRIECPEGHKQVDTKCIPLVIGSNAVLIDLNALGLVVGNTPSDELYDYDDIGEEEQEKLANPRPHFGSDMQMGDVEKSMEGLTVELRPPSKDEPLKFNIFESKFNILHEEPLEDYSALSNEGEKEAKNVTASDVTEQQQQHTLNATDAAKILNDLASESSNISENNFALAKPSEKTSSGGDAKDISSTQTTTTSLVDDEDFKIDAVSLPVGGLDTQNQPQKLAIFQKDTDDGMQLVTTIMDPDASAPTTGDEKPQENDIQTLLQTESFLPLQQPTNATATAATILQNQHEVQANNSSSIAGVLTTISLPTIGHMENTPEVLNLNIEEEMTTLPSAMEPEPPQKSKQEFTRSVTMNPLMADESIANDVEDNEQVNDSTTLETEMIDEPNAETTTPIQLDETTVIETFASLSSTPETLQQQQPQEQQQYDLQDLLMQQEQALKDFEELQRMRSKGQTDQHAVLKKSKVEPVEVLATTTTANSLPTTDAEEVAAETVTPLLTFDNENDNSNSNDRFYYQHFAKQDIKEAAQQQPPLTVPTSTTTTTSVTTKLTKIKAMPLTTSEIDRTEELRLNNKLVKGITPMPTATATGTRTTTTTTEKPKTTLKIKTPTSLSSASQSESSSLAAKTLPNSQQIWSKIMPLLTSTTTTTTTTTTTATPKSTKTVSISENSSIDSSTEYTENISNDIQATPTKATSSESALLLSSSSTRNNRNSKITRIHTTADVMAPETTTEPHSSSESFTATSSDSSTVTATLNDTYEPYWWLPVAWRFDKPNDSVSSERPVEQQETEQEQAQDQTQEVKSEEPSLLLRFWSTYHASKSS